MHSLAGKLGDKAATVKMRTRLVCVAFQQEVRKAISQRQFGDFLPL